MHANKTVVNGKYVYQENCYQKFPFKCKALLFRLQTYNVEN